jgi:phage regulator Rha-like protein
MVSELLPIQSVNDVDVVDSRLIATELGIQHKNLIETIRKYEDRLEKRGHLTFETYDVKMPNGGYSSRLDYYWLNERQCIFLTTLSRNTEQVVELKDKIEESFYQAKQLITKQHDTIQELTLKLALANAEKDVAIAQQKLLDTRHYIVTALPEPVQQKILGYQIVEKIVEKKVVYKESEFIRNDSTVNKTSLCKRYGIMSKSGSCDYKRLNKILATANLPSEAWLEVKDIQKNNELKVEYLNILDNLVIQDSRQLWIGE